MLCGLCRRQAGLHQFQCSGDLVLIHWLTARIFAAGTGGDNAILGALGNQPALKVGNGAEHMENQLARGR